MKNMFKFILVCIALTGCWGNSSVDNSVICQPKKIYNVTPMICDDRIDVDVSLGVMRNGVGSMSTQDEMMNVPNQQDVATLEQAIKDGKLVEINYDERRFSLCMPEIRVKSVKIVENVENK